MNAETENAMETEPIKKKRGRPKGSGSGKKRKTRGPGRPKGGGKRGRPPADFIRLNVGDLLQIGRASVTVKNGKLVVEIPFR
jgi:hypothetical protein